MRVAIDLTKTVKEIITTMKTVIDDIQDNYQTKTDIADTYESQTDASTAHTALQNSIAAKQDKLTFDSTPTDNSSNPVTSSGIKAALDEKLNVSGNDTATGTMTFKKKIVLQDGATSTGAFVIDPNTVSYNEDLRLNESTGKWATIYMGAPLKSTSGSNANAWGISRTPNGQLDFFKGASWATLNTGLRLNGNGTALLGGKEVVKNTGTWDINISGTATKATQDSNGNNISTTYATKTEVAAIDLSNYYTKEQVDSAISTAISAIIDGDSKSY